MAFERWGSLSVADHIDAAALAANVLLYDRVVLPLMAEQPDRDERAYWEERGWDPKLQRKRLDDLQELAVGRPWNWQRRNEFKSRLAELKVESRDAQKIGQRITREILAQEQVREKFPGVEHVTVIAAYNSIDLARKDFRIEDPEGALAAQAVLLARKLAVPNLPKPEETLILARDLSRDTTFRTKRANLFDWQQVVAQEKVPPEAVVARLSTMTDEYNDAVLQATKQVYWKFAFTVFGIGLGFAGGVTIGVAASAALSLLQFATFDRKPAVDSNSPVAMFHDIEQRIGLKLKA
jgi:hypothetical protein